jgi:hypothetical protein
MAVFHFMSRALVTHDNPRRRGHALMQIKSAALAARPALRHHAGA